MAILGSLARGAFGFGKAAATGGFAARAAVGATVGGVGGFVNALDYENPNMAIGSVLRGAAMGAVVGGALGANKSIGRMLAPPGKGAWRYTPTSLMAKSLLRNLPSTTASAISAAGSLAGSALKLGVTAIKHPFATAGVVGGGYLGYSHLTGPGSPTLRGDIESAQGGLNATTKVNYNTQALAAETMRESGVAPMGSLGTVPQMMGPMQKAFQNSTNGLVQGLHRARHS